MMTAEHSKSDDDRTFVLLADALDPLEPPRALRDRLLGELRGPERFTRFASEMARRFDLSIERARETLLKIPDAEAWKPGFLLGARMIPIAHDAMYLTLARLPAGTRIGHHRHAAREITMVLDGVLLEDGRTPYADGATCEKAPGSEHAIEVGGDEECLVVFAILLERR